MASAISKFYNTGTVYGLVRNLLNLTVLCRFTEAVSLLWVKKAKWFKGSLLMRRCVCIKPFWEWTFSFVFVY